jgi:hypothetical protein
MEIQLSGHLSCIIRRAEMKRQNQFWCESGRVENGMGTVAQSCDESLFASNDRLPEVQNHPGRWSD